MPNAVSRRLQRHTRRQFRLSSLKRNVSNCTTDRQGTQEIWKSKGIAVGSKRSHGFGRMDQFADESGGVLAAKAASQSENVSEARLRTDSKLMPRSMHGLALTHAARILSLPCSSLVRIVIQTRPDQDFPAQVRTVTVQFEERLKRIN